MSVKKLIPLTALLAGTLLAGTLLACGNATGPKFPNPDGEENPPPEQPEQPGVVG